MPRTKHAAKKAVTKTTELYVYAEPATYPIDDINLSALYASEDHAQSEAIDHVSTYKVEQWIYQLVPVRRVLPGSPTVEQL